MTEATDPLRAWIEEHRDQMVEALRGVLRIPSVQEPASGPGAPFGGPVREALDYTLALCERLGFRTRDVEGYAGHAEFGEGVEMVAALGHLDVVPEGSGWTHPPYGAEIADGAIYARGAADDKGPTYAALFAAKALMESGLPLRRRVRVIFGLNEESGFACVRHYWGPAGEERPVLAFTPDAEFPLVYAEKGIVNLTLRHERAPAGDGLRVAELHGGLRPNMVPDRALARLTGSPQALYAATATLAGWWHRYVTVTPTEGAIEVRAVGRSAHGSLPHDGDNAVVRLARALEKLSLPDDRPWIEWLVRTGDPDGSGLGIEGCDDVVGALTSNLGLARVDADAVTATYNVRYPVRWSGAEVLQRLAPTLTGSDWSLAESTDSPPLHGPLDEEPARTLLDVYRRLTGDTESLPQTMGGGTYARATPHAVAFGAAFPGGADGPPHEPDERFSIEPYIRAAVIYAHALHELAR